MRILLVNPAFDYYSRHLLIGEPLSLAYLAAYLKQHGHDNVSVLDAAAGSIQKNGESWHFGLSDMEVKERIKKFKPDLVGITCPFSLRVDATSKVAKLAKTVDKKIITVVGGIHPTIFPLETLSNENVDYVILGEGEESFFELIKAIQAGGKIHEGSIDGCAHKDEGEGKIIAKRKFIDDLDTIPFPARDLLPMEYYIQRKTSLYGLGKGRSASILTSRSCPNQCSFCSMFLSHGTKWRARSAENVFEEIKFLKEKFQIEEIFFMDDNLTFDKARMVKLCEMILTAALKLRWNTPNGVAANCLDSELITLMKRAGCVNICIGIESGNEAIRNSVIRKKLTDEKIDKVLEDCKKTGLPVVGFFIIGIPGENESTFRDTLKMVKNHPFSMIATSFFTPLPGTELHKKCLRQGYIDKDLWRRLERFNTPLVETPDFTTSTLRKWEKQIYYEFVKSHFWDLFFSTITLRNEFFKLGLIRRFIQEKL